MAFDFTKLSQIQDSLEAPVYQEIASYEDADENLRPIAQFIKTNTIHNEYIDPNRIKFLFTSKVKKDGGRYVVGSLLQRSDIEKYVDDRYDFIVIVFYPVWVELDGKNKIIQLDKILSGVDTGTIDKPVLKKKQADSKEFVDNMKAFGADNVLNSSEIVHMTCERIVKQQKGEQPDQ